MYFVVFVVAMGPGFIVEAVQGLTSRDVDLSDILRKMVGILAGLYYASVVHDRLHNQDHVGRYDKTLHLEQGLNEIEIPLSEIEQGPLGRELDLTNVAGIVLFASERKNSLQIELSDIYLK